MEQRGECVITGEQALADPELKPLEHHLRDDKQVFENLALVVFHLKESAKNHSLYSPYYRTLNAGQRLRRPIDLPSLLANHGHRLPAGATAWLHALAGRRGPDPRWHLACWYAYPPLTRRSPTD